MTLGSLFAVLGTGCSAVLKGTDEFGSITITTGTGVGALGSPSNLASLIFGSTSFTSNASLELIPLDATTAELVSGIVPPSPNNVGRFNNFVIVADASGAALADNTTYSWAYRVR